MRNIFTVSAIQGAISESHPEGMLSNYVEPIKYDSRSFKATATNPNGDEGAALIAARAKFWELVNQLTMANNANRAMWTVTLTDAYGVQIAKQKFGAFPDMTPAPELAPEEGGGD